MFYLHFALFFCFISATAFAQSHVFLTPQHKIVWGSKPTVQSSLINVFGDASWRKLKEETNGNLSFWGYRNGSYLVQERHLDMIFNGIIVQSRPSLIKALLDSALKANPDLVQSDTAAANAKVWHSKKANLGIEHLVLNDGLEQLLYWWLPKDE